MVLHTMVVANIGTQIKNMISGRIMDIDANGYLTIGEINNPVHPVESEDKYYANLNPQCFEKINDSIHQNLKMYLRNQIW